MKFKTNQNTEIIIVDLCMRISAQTELYRMGFSLSQKTPLDCYTGDSDSSGFLSYGVDWYFFLFHVYFNSLTLSISHLFSLVIVLIYDFLTYFSSSVQAISVPTFPVRLLRKDVKVLPATEVKDWRWELILVYYF